MKRRLIKDFEDDYCILENGTILDLHTNKLKRTYKRGLSPTQFIDLYKNGELVLRCVPVIKIIMLQYFNVTSISNFLIKYLDGNCNNLSLDNLEVTRKVTYHPRVSVYKKPSKVYHFTINEAIVINEKERDDITYLNKISTTTYLNKKNKIKKKSNF